MSMRSAEASARAEEPDDVGRAWLAQVRRVVVKIGSRALVDEQKLLDERQLRELVGQMARLQASGREVVCVTSGAVAAGLRELGCLSRPHDLPSLQAAAAIGQARLVELYRHAFAEHGITAAQILLTHDDMRSRERHLNARNTVHRLIEAGAVPVINENDSVAVDEIRVGDNDLLSALVANLVRADLLVLLTTEDGLYTKPPGQGGSLVPCVRAVSDEVRRMAGGAGSDVTTGGMRTKVQAAEMVTRAGERAVIANGRAPAVLDRIFRGEALGTVFEPVSQRLRGRQRWIAFFDHPRGELHVDDGAAGALTGRGGSLLPIGIRSIDGQFERGAPVRIIDPSGAEIARGLVNYPSTEIQQILGCRSEDIGQVLGRCEHDEVVHRDNLVLR